MLINYIYEPGHFQLHLCFHCKPMLIGQLCYVTKNLNKTLNFPLLLALMFMLIKKELIYTASLLEISSTVFSLYFDKQL